MQTSRVITRWWLDRIPAWLRSLRRVAKAMTGRAVSPVLLLAALILGLPGVAWAHIGSPNVSFEGAAGPYPVRVTIRPPGVVPGLAEIDVRLLEGQASRVAVLPVYWKSGRAGAPPPDPALPVKGDTNLYHASLWLMASGAYSVDVTVEGAQGQGSIVVPVNSVATTRNPMPRGFGWLLAALGTLLFCAAVKLVSAAFGEGLLEPGADFPRRRRWRARLTAVAGAALFAFILSRGKAWWDREDSFYRNVRLYRPAAVSASVKLDPAQPTLQLSVDHPGSRSWTPLIPDHGKLMHLFLVREPERNAFAHLHPVQQEGRVFVTPLPPLPPGEYHAYADVTHENGFAETLAAKFTLPEMPAAFVKRWQTAVGPLDVVCSPTAAVSASGSATAFDPDDSWHADRPGASLPTPAATALGGQAVYRLADGHLLVWEKGDPLIQSRATSLRFKLLAPDGQVMPLEPYMGMFGHAVVRRDDGTVFAHVHPSGNFSMAAQYSFLSRAANPGVASNGEAPLAALVTSTNHPAQVHPSAGTNDVKAVSFPYEFPQAGPYRLWVQLKSHGKVQTGAFEVVVGEK